MERKEYPSSDKHYSGTSVSNQNQSRELATLTSANKVDSMLVVLQGIHKVCEKLACWSTHLLKRNLDFITYTPYLMIFAILTEFSAVATLQNYLQFSSRQLFRSPLALKHLQTSKGKQKVFHLFITMTALLVYFTKLYTKVNIE